MNKTWTAGALWMLFVLAGCGGGDSGTADDPPPATPAEIRQAVQAEDTTSGGVDQRALTALPSAGAPVVGRDSALVIREQVGPLSTTPTAVNFSTQPLGAHLPSTFVRPVPAFALVNGTIHLRSSTGLPPRRYLQGDDILVDLRSDDGAVILLQRMTAYQVIPLAGAVTEAPALLRQDPAWSVLFTNPALLKADAQYGAGATLRRSRYELVGDAVLLVHCSGTDLQRTTLEACGAAATIEAAAADEWPDVDLRSGTYVTVQGRRAWVQNQPLPASMSPMTSTLIFVEVNGRVYFGLLQRDKTPVVAPNGRQDLLTMNPQAMDSLRAAVTF